VKFVYNDGYGSGLAAVLVFYNVQPGAAADWKTDDEDNNKS
jgi:hypothetical protein